MALSGDAAQTAAAKAVKYAEHALFAAVIAYSARVVVTEGPSGLVKRVLQGIRALPLLGPLVSAAVRREAQGAVRDLLKRGDDSEDVPLIAIPQHGRPVDEVLEEMARLRAKETAAERGRMFAYVYTKDEDPHYQAISRTLQVFADDAGAGSVEHCVNKAYAIFQHSNGLNPLAFPSLRKFETEVVSMTASMLNGDAKCAGFLTSGGTESIFLAMKAYRDRARALWPYITEPEIVAPITAHPAFDKACALFDIKVVHTPVTDTYAADVGALKAAITPNTIGLVASAPQYPHGIVDPITEIAAIAKKRGLPMHVDACFGGFALPWVEKLGFPVPTFDFRVDGVTSISADIHKYGWGPKGSSVVVFKNKQYRRFAIYAYSQWPGGLFASPSILGSRPGGTIAAAWAVMQVLGQDGYTKLAAGLMDTVVKIKDAVRAIPQLELVGESHMTSLAIKSAPDSKVDILALADVMEKMGWGMERQQKPPCLHFTIMPVHATSCDQLIEDLRKATELVERNEIPSDGSAALYGMAAKIPDDTVVNDFLTDLMNEMYTLSPAEKQN